jgi:hypothetical protein
MAGKMIMRRTIPEEEFLEDLVQWVLISGAGPKDPLFRRWTQFPRKLQQFRKCSGSMVTKDRWCIIRMIQGGGPCHLAALA